MRRTGLGLMVILLASCGGRTLTTDGAADRGPRLDTAGAREGGVKDRRMSTEAPNTSVFVLWVVEQLGADCMPMVPADPITLTGHAEILNNGSISVGPIQFTAGRILRLTGEELATFSVAPIQDVVIKPGEGMSPKITKVANSLKPAFDCGTCGTSVRVELAYAGAGLPAGAKVVSSDVKISCAY
jgi:hypothetical protein